MSEAIQNQPNETDITARLGSELRKSVFSCSRALPGIIFNYAAVMPYEFIRIVKQDEHRLSQSFPNIDSAWRYNYLYNTGDFSNGYIDSMLTHIALSVLLRNRISEKTRNIISTAAGIISVVAAETILPVGSPDIADIPAGVVGSLTYLGVTLGGSWIWDRYQKSRTPSTDQLAIS